MKLSQKCVLIAVFSLFAGLSAHAEKGCHLTIYHKIAVVKETTIGLYQEQKSCSALATQIINGEMKLDDLEEKITRVDFSYETAEGWETKGSLVTYGPAL